MKKKKLFKLYLIFIIVFSAFSTLALSFGFPGYVKTSIGCYIGNAVLSLFMTTTYSLPIFLLALIIVHIKNKKSSNIKKTVE